MIESEKKLCGIAVGTLVKWERRIIMLSKVLEVFKKRYRRETEYMEIEYSMLPGFKLKNKNESVEDRIKRLSDKNFISGFKLSVGSY